MLQVIKLGGSILTQKEADTPIARTAYIESIGETLQTYVQQHPNDSLVIVHGAGGYGHGIASAYNLVSGAIFADQIAAALRCQESVAELHSLVVASWQNIGIPVVSVPTHTVITQKEGRIYDVQVEPIRTVIAQGGIPVLYGDVVPDVAWNYSICSGDTIAAHLTKALDASRLLFATDIDGVCTQDPHIYPDAVLISEVSVADILNHTLPGITTSHTTDVTGGLYGKLQSFVDMIQDSSVTEVMIFNGLQKNWLLPALEGDIEICTRIRAEHKT